MIGPSPTAARLPILLLLGLRKSGVACSPSPVDMPQTGSRMTAVSSKSGVRVKYSHQTRQLNRPRILSHDDPDLGAPIGGASCCLSPASAWGSRRTKSSDSANGRFAVPAIFTAFQAGGSACGSPTPSSSRMAERSMPKAPSLGSAPRFRAACPRPKRPRAWPKRWHSAP
jgi:hypothetical protein